MSPDPSSDDCSDLQTTLEACGFDVDVDHQLTLTVRNADLYADGRPVKSNTVEIRQSDDAKPGISQIIVGGGGGGGD